MEQFKLILITVNLNVTITVILYNYCLNLISQDMATEAILKASKNKHNKWRNRIFRRLFYRRWLPCNLECFEFKLDCFKKMKESGTLSCLEEFTGMNFRQLQKSFSDERCLDGLQIGSLVVLMSFALLWAFSLIIGKINDKTSTDVKEGKLVKNDYELDNYDDDNEEKSVKNEVNEETSVRNEVKACQRRSGMKTEKNPFKRRKLHIKGKKLRCFLKLKNGEVEVLHDPYVRWHYEPKVPEYRQIFVDEENKLPVYFKDREIIAGLGYHGDGDYTAMSLSCARNLGLQHLIQSQQKGSNGSLGILKDIQLSFNTEMKAIKLDVSIVQDDNKKPDVSLGRDFLMKYGVTRKFLDTGSLLIFPYYHRPKSVGSPVPVMQFDAQLGKWGISGTAKIELSEQSGNYIDEKFLHTSGRRFSIFKCLLPCIHYEKECKSFCIVTPETPHYGSHKTKSVPISVRKGVDKNGADIVLGTDFLQAVRAIVDYRDGGLVIRAKFINTAVKLNKRMVNDQDGELEKQDNSEEIPASEEVSTHASEASSSAPQQIGKNISRQINKFVKLLLIFTSMAIVLFLYIAAYVGYCLLYDKIPFILAYFWEIGGLLKKPIFAKSFD